MLLFNRTLLLSLLFSLAFLLLPLRGSLRAQETTFPELEEESLLQTLFEAEDYTVEKGGKWAPDFEENLNFNISDDGYCYTNLDTVMMVPLDTDDESDLSLAVLVFTTYSYEGEGRSDCHGCAPDISIALCEEMEDGWKLQAFRKHVTELGSWGLRGDLSIVQIGEGLYALNMESGFTGQGYTVGTSELISLASYDELEEIFSITTYDYGPAGCEEECDAEWCQYYRSIEREMNFLANPDPDSEYSDVFDLIVTEVNAPCKGKEQKRTERYVFNGERYEKVCE